MPHVFLYVVKRNLFINPLNKNILNLFKSSNEKEENLEPFGRVIQICSGNIRINILLMNVKKKLLESSITTRIVYQ